MSNTGEDGASMDAFEAVDAFLDALRRELRDNPELTYRLVKALPTDVHFLGKDAVKFVNLIELIGDHPVEVAAARLDGFSLAELKKLAQAANLATSLDMKGLDQEALVSMLISRTKAKIAERRL